MTDERVDESTAPKVEAPDGSSDPGAPPALLVRFGAKLVNNPKWFDDKDQPWIEGGCPKCDGLMTAREVEWNDGQPAVRPICAEGCDERAVLAAVGWCPPGRPSSGRAAGTSQAEQDGSSAASSWTLVDLAPVLSGAGPSVEPTILARPDSQCLLYPGKLHWLSGEPETGKGWISLHGCVEQMRDGARVLYVDFEDQAQTAVSRLRALGCEDELIAARFLYISPDEAQPERAIGELSAYSPSLVILDGVTEAMVLAGLDPLSGTDSAAWIGGLARPLARAGAAVLAVDHVVKRKDERGRWPYGSQHKLAGVDVAYGVTVSAPMGRGRVGHLHLVVQKDRLGYVRGFAHGKEAAGVRLTSSGERMAVSLLVPGAEADGAEPFRPTKLMERVSSALEARTPLTGDGIRAAVVGKAQWTDKARDQLVIEGHARVELDGRSKLYSSVEPYREHDEPQRDGVVPGASPLSVPPRPLKGRRDERTSPSGTSSHRGGTDSSAPVFNAPDSACSVAEAQLAIAGAAEPGGPDAGDIRDGRVPSATPATQQRDKPTGAETSERAQTAETAASNGHSPDLADRARELLSAPEGVHERKAAEELGVPAKEARDLLRAQGGHEVGSGGRWIRAETAP